MNGALLSKPGLTVRMFGAACAGVEPARKPAAAIPPTWNNLDFYCISASPNEPTDRVAYTSHSTLHPLAWSEGITCGKANTTKIPAPSVRAKTRRTLTLVRVPFESISLSPDEL